MYFCFIQSAMKWIGKFINMTHLEILEEIGYSNNHSAIVAALQLVNEGKASVQSVAYALLEHLQNN